MDALLYQQIGRRIRHAREALGMSQEELARRLDCSSATISYYESGERKISLADLQRISSIFGLSLSHFVDDESTITPIALHLRATKEVRPSARRSLENFLSFAEKNATPTPLLKRELVRRDPGETAASILNEYGILRPPVLPRQLAASLGVSVYDWDFPDEISGIFFSNGKLDCIGVNENHPHVRQRFTIGHELGHFFLDGQRNLFVDFLGVDAAIWENDDDLRRRERQANRLSANLLMPKPWVEKDVRRHGLDLTLLARRYEVSEQAMWFRLLELGLTEQGD